MNKSLKISITTVGMYAGILSFLHGLFEILQGYNEPDNLFIFAISKSNQTSEMWHGNFPAMTVIPNYLLTGIVVCLISLLIISLFSSLLLRGRRFRFRELFPLSLILLPVGGGFIPPFLLMITAFSCLLINKEFKIIKNPIMRKFLKAIWLSSIALLIIWSVTEWILGYYINSILVRYGTFFFLVGIILPLIILLLGFINNRIEISE